MGLVWPPYPDCFLSYLLLPGRGGRCIRTLSSFSICHLHLTALNKNAKTREFKSSLQAKYIGSVVHRLSELLSNNLKKLRKCKLTEWCPYITNVVCSETKGTPIQRMTQAVRRHQCCCVSLFNQIKTFMNGALRRGSGDYRYEYTSRLKEYLLEKKSF